jgi:hypothetical protein
MFIIGLAGEFRPQQIEHIVRTWQAADMRRLDPVGILLE